MHKIKKNIQEPVSRDENNPFQKQMKRDKKRKEKKEKRKKNKKIKISFLLHNVGHHAEQFILVYFMRNVCIFPHNIYQKIH
jgi:predicted O-linked N-acetylglucosamine transferase (SPINDLY family)